MRLKYSTFLALSFILTSKVFGAGADIAAARRNEVMQMQGQVRVLQAQLARLPADSRDRPHILTKIQNLQARIELLA